ncbi:MAG: hypothetical protein A2X97_02280 [Bdellovibrionales bacterium GWA1_52_35]|nr:MAG: hypothetical protein A2X97_02280 [Bdellovibrionales bacterium GWA1_52_35]
MGYLRSENNSLQNRHAPHYGEEPMVYLIEFDSTQHTLAPRNRGRTRSAAGKFGRGDVIRTRDLFVPKDS